MPLERAIAWGPALVGDARPSRPSAPGQIFFSPDALRDVTAQVAREGAGSLGFFVGERYRDAESKEPWVLVDAVIPVAKQPTRIPIALLLDATIELARAQARSARRHVVGWYHSAECSQPVLTATDAAAHDRHFAKAHAFMLMIAVGRNERQAALFRPSLERRPVPFFELIDQESALDQGTRSTAVSWTNYFTVETVAREEPGRTSGAQWLAVEPPPPEPHPPLYTPPGEAPAAAPEPTARVSPPEPPTPRITPPEPRVTAPPEAPEPTARVTPREPPPPARSEPRAPPQPRPRVSGPHASRPLSSRTPPARARVSGGTPAPTIPAEPEPMAPASPPTRPATPSPRARVSDAVLRREPEALDATAPLNAFVEAWHPVQGTAPLPPFRIIDPAVFDAEGGHWWRLRSSLKPFLLGGLATLALVTLGVLAVIYTPALWSERRDAPEALTPVAPGPLEMTARFVDNAVARYKVTARSFDGGRATCDDLSAVLVGVDNTWMAYSVERATLTVPLGAAGVERERGLESEVEAAERHFRASECPRP